MGLNKYFQKVMITFKQFLEEANKKKVKPLRSKKEVMKVLNAQGGIGGKAVEKYDRKNPDRGVRTYNLNDLSND